MKRIIASILSVFISSGDVSSQDLFEFSTSMDFEEFATILKHLETIDGPLAEELTSNIEQFKKTTSPGDYKRYSFNNFDGYLELEREDEYAFGIATFTPSSVQEKISDAYDKGTEELDI